MRTVACLFLFVALGARAQGVPDAYEMARRIADSGAPQIALARVEQAQPAAAGARGWGDWEQLRCTLLARLDRHQELIARVRALPPNAPERALRACLVQGARAAVATAQGATAREFLARLMWRNALSADEMRQARLQVLESYLAEERPRDAYLLMLRYQQDYRPLERETAARFVDALLAAGMEKDAINWLAQLDDASPTKLALRLKAGLVAPDAAIAQARAALARSNTAAYWRVVEQAATLQKDSTLRAEALENILQLAGDRPAAPLAATAGELWQAYAAAAQDIANRNQLLVGDDAGWADFAARRTGAGASEGRALFAFLARRSNDRATRHNAQLQLVFSLQGAKLALTALKLFADAKQLPVAELDAQARYLLGGMAAEHNQFATAAAYWQGLAAPPNLDVDQWRMRLAPVLVRAGKAEPAADALRELVAGKKALPADVVQRAAATLQEIADNGYARIAGELYRELLPLAAPRERREIMSGLARIAESAGDFRAAADHYLEAALLADAPAADAFAINARLAAASNLGRAGLRDDARAQFDWLRRNVKDAEKLEQIRREAQKL